MYHWKCLHALNANNEMTICEDVLHDWFFTYQISLSRKMEGAWNMYTSTAEKTNNQTIQQFKHISCSEHAAMQMHLSYYQKQKQRIMLYQLNKS